MTTLVLNSETSALPIGELVKQVERGALEVRDSQGHVVALMLSPADHEAWTYAEACADLKEHRDEVKSALARRGGSTTQELLSKAAKAANSKP